MKIHLAKIHEAPRIKPLLLPDVNEFDMKKLADMSRKSVTFAKNHSRSRLSEHYWFPR